MSRTLALVATVVAGVLCVGGSPAGAQSTPSAQAQSANRTVGGPRASAPAPTAPPLPLGDQARAQGARRSMVVPAASDPLAALARIPLARRGNARLVRYDGPRPPIPKLTDLLNHRKRWKQSASGGTITLTGTSNTAYLDDQTLAYGAQVYWLCQNLKPSTTYRYVVFSPDGYAYSVQTLDYNSRDNGGGTVYRASFTTDNQGRCIQVGTGADAGQQIPWYANLTLQTPLAASPDPVTAIGATRTGATDSPYSGVWTIAVQNTANSQFEAEAYSVVLGTLNFSTYSNSALTTKANDFASGASVYVAASGLNPAHFYAFGFVNTAGNGLPCVYTIPGGSQTNNNATCFLAGTTGISPTSQSFAGQYVTPANGANSVGTMAVELFDATTNDLISTQQISLNPASVVWSPLIPYNGGTNGTNLGDTFATDGIINSSASGGPTAEQSVTGLTYQASGVISGHVYRITVSNANGVVLSSTTTDAAGKFGPQAFSPVPSFTASSTTTGPQKVDFPINLGNLTAFGQTQIPFAPNVYTAQLYDVTAGTVVGSKSFTLLAYAGGFQWTNPAGASVNTAAGGLKAPVTATLRNTAGILYGAWNGDGIKAITITNDSGNAVSLALQAGVTTTTDSLGQQWTLTNPNAQTVTLTPTTAGQSLPVNATIPIPFTISSAAAACTSVCLLRTSITPLHGITGSSTDPTMTNRASNGLAVYGPGVVGGTAQPSYGWAIGAFSNAAALGTPRYAQMMYRSGTNGATTGTYQATITVNNTGTAQALYNVQFDMPATIDPNRQTPTLVSATVNGANQTANWGIFTQNGAAPGPPYQDVNLGNNAFAIRSLGKTFSIPAGKSATFVINIPILLASFPFQEIPATANYVDQFNVGGLSAYAVGPTNTLTSAIAGTQNIDSTELGVFSLDTALMAATVTPAVVPALAGASATFKLLNTSTGLDANPDYINQVLLTVPNGAIPTSVTATSPGQPATTWYVNPTGTLGQYRIELCQPGPAPCAAATDAKALPPGAELDVQFNYVAPPSIGQYPIAWCVKGANGIKNAADPSPCATVAQQPILNVQNTTAQTAFTFAGGYTPTPVYPPLNPGPIDAVPGNGQPAVGSWADFNQGNSFVYELFNNGSTAITDIAVTIPWANKSGQETDPTDWTVKSVYVYGSGATGAQCSGSGVKQIVQPVRGSPGTNGKIVLSGCNVPVGQTIDVYFNALSPYDTSSTSPFQFPASVAFNGTPPATPNTLPKYNNADTVQIKTDARIVITIPTAPGANLTGLFGNGTAPVTNCLNCTYSPNLVTAQNKPDPLINFGNLSGTFTATDVLAASIYSDDSNGWSLSVSADVNPTSPNPNPNGLVTTWVTASSSTPTAGTLTRAVTTTPGQTIPNTLGAPLLLSSYSGATGTALHQPIDNIMSYQVQLDPAHVNNANTTTIQLTYTLIPN